MFRFIGIPQCHYSHSLQICFFITFCWYLNKSLPELKINFFQNIKHWGSLKCAAGLEICSFPDSLIQKSQFFQRRSTSWPNGMLGQLRISHDILKKTCSESSKTIKFSEAHLCHFWKISVLFACKLTVFKSISSWSDSIQSVQECWKMIKNRLIQVISW